MKLISGLSVLRSKLQTQRNKLLSTDNWIGLSSVLRPLQHSIGLYGRRFLQVKRPNQQYQSTEGESCKGKQHKKTKKKENTHTQNSIQITVTQTNTASPLVYNTMGWLGDSSHRGQVR